MSATVCARFNEFLSCSQEEEKNETKVKETEIWDTRKQMTENTYLMS